MDRIDVRIDHLWGLRLLGEGQFGAEDGEESLDSGVDVEGGTDEISPIHW